MYLGGISGPWGFRSLLTSGVSGEKDQSKASLLVSVFKNTALFWTRPALTGTLPDRFTAQLFPIDFCCVDQCFISNIRRGIIKNGERGIKNGCCPGAELQKHPILS